jgi:hypothetical protein
MRILFWLTLLGGVIVASGRGDRIKWADPDGGAGLCATGAANGCAMTLVVEGAPEP